LSSQSGFIRQATVHSAESAARYAEATGSAALAMQVSSGLTASQFQRSMDWDLEDVPTCVGEGRPVLVRLFICATAGEAMVCEELGENVS